MDTLLEWQRWNILITQNTNDFIHGFIHSWVVLSSCLKKHTNSHKNTKMACIQSLTTVSSFSLTLALYIAYILNCWLGSFLASLHLWFKYYINAEWSWFILGLNVEVSIAECGRTLIKQQALEESSWHESFHIFA